MTSKPTKKGFNFSKLPVLVMEDILDEMHLTDIFGLSLCSKKCTTAIRSANRRLPPVRMTIEIDSSKKIEVFGEKSDDDPEYEYDSDQSLPSSYNSCHREREKEVMMYGLLRWDFMEESSWRFDCPKSKFNINGEEFLTRQKPNDQEVGTDYLSFSSKSTMDAKINAITTHLLYIFPRCYVQKLDLSFNRLEPVFDVKKAIAGIESTQKLSMCLFGVEKNPPDFEHIHKNIEVTKDYKCWRTGPVYEKFVPKIKCTDEIISENASWMYPDFLMTMNCRRVKLENTRFTTEDIMKFLRRWKTSDWQEVGNIKWLEIKNSEAFGEFNLEEFEPKPWDPKRRPEIYNMKQDRRYFKEALDIERADGTLASFQHSNNPQFLTFVVWPDEKEDEDSDDDDDLSDEPSSFEDFDEEGDVLEEENNEN